ncbi:Pentatricopeptide repeat-containing protein [Vitis vinifera]|uniref:Pentatricopeptide repeat-containing protein n=1 Tax=Vitis vinifera TaxID=29760 RepID=A0A438EL98_VITVI|nr:Pentatricopeptide repeat-containing protein [Vitis vinifera]
MLEEAKTLVESMKRNGNLMELESYNIWLLGCDGWTCKNGLISDARMIMGLMISSGIGPDTVTYSTLLHGCCSTGKVLKANNILHEMMRRGCSPNTYTCNILLHSLWKEGRIFEAEKLLQKMNERSYDLDNVTCNIVIDGLCKSGKLDEAVEIVKGMWIHGSAALGNLGNSFIAGRLDEARKKFIEMMGKNLHPDSIIYDTFIHSFCKHGKISSAFRVLKDMEKRGCNKSLQTYNSLILGLGNEMLQKGISPNISSFRLLIKAFCKASDFGVVKEVFEIALSICGHKEALYSLMFNELLIGGEVSDAKELFDAALDRCFDLGNFQYNELIEKLCKDEMLENASDILHKMIDKGYRFDPASFMPVIDGLGKRGKKHDADELAERMMDMASEGMVENKITRNESAFNRQKRNKFSGSDWQTIIHRSHVW